MAIDLALSLVLLIKIGRISSLYMAILYVPIWNETCKSR